MLGGYGYTDQKTNRWFIQWVYRPTINRFHSKYANIPDVIVTDYSTLVSVYNPV